MPPITTVANAACTSAPVPRSNGHRMKPRCHQGRHRAGPQRASAPSRMASSSGVPASRRLLDVGIITRPLEHGDARQRDEADGGGDRRECRAATAPGMPPVSANGMPVKTNQAILDVAEHGEQQHGTPAIATPAPRFEALGRRFEFSKVPPHDVNSPPGSSPRQRRTRPPATKRSLCRGRTLALTTMSLALRSRG